MVNISKLQGFIHSAICAFELRIPIDISNSYRDMILDESDLSKAFSYPTALYERTGDYLFNENMEQIYQFQLTKIYCSDSDLLVHLPDSLKNTIPIIE